MPSIQEEIVPVVVELEPSLAEQVEEVKSEDPDFIPALIRYGMIRRAIFDVLSTLPEGASATKVLT